MRPFRQPVIRSRLFLGAPACRTGSLSQRIRIGEVPAVEMKKIDAIVILKFRGFRNSDIARQLNVSRQYVSRVCNSFQRVAEQGKESTKRRGEWEPGKNELLSVGAASRLLGVSPATVRRWSDKRQIPSIRLDIGRRDRRFKATDLQQLLADI
jgi:excisionase family DNA binding protein